MAGAGGGRVYKHDGYREMNRQSITASGIFCVFARLEGSRRHLTDCNRYSSTAAGASAIKVGRGEHMDRRM